MSLVKQFITELKGRELYKSTPNNVSFCLAQVQFLTITATMNIFTYLMTLESAAWNWENYFACPVGVSGLSSYSSVNKEHLAFSWYMNNDQKAHQVPSWMEYVGENDNFSDVVCISDICEEPKIFDWNLKYCSDSCIQVSSTRDIAAITTSTVIYSDISSMWITDAARTFLPMLLDHAPMVIYSRCLTC